jgi:hypothetical protein
MFGNIKSWLGRPYSDDMDAFHWFLFFGFLIALTILWGIVLRNLRNVVGLLIIVTAGFALSAPIWSLQL